MTTALDESKIRGMTPGERTALAKQLTSEPGGKSPKKKKKSSLGLWFFLFYGVGCAVGGVYFDRQVMPKVNLWLGQKAQVINGYGQEQTVTTFVSQAGLAADEQTAALASVEAVYRMRREGLLSETQLEQLGRAEASFIHAATNETSPSQDEVRGSLKVFAALANR